MRKLSLGLGAVVWMGLVGCGAEAADPAQNGPGTGTDETITTMPGGEHGLGPTGTVGEAKAPVSKSPPVPACKAGECTDLSVDVSYGGTLTAASVEAVTSVAVPDAALNPCILSPATGAVVPWNWLPPQVKVAKNAAVLFYEVRVTAASQAGELVAYFQGETWTMPATVWGGEKAQGLSKNSNNEDITFTVKAYTATGVGTSTTTLKAAPVDAGGVMVYWAATSPYAGLTTSELIAIKVGAEGEKSALKPVNIAEREMLDNTGVIRVVNDSKVTDVAPGQSACIGCHTSTPDGKDVGYTDHLPWVNVLASIQEESAGAIPAYTTPLARRVMQQPWLGMMTFSDKFWGGGTRLMVTSHGLGMNVFGWPQRDKPTYSPPTKNVDTLIWINAAAGKDVADVPAANPDALAFMFDAQLAKNGENYLAGKTWGWVARTGDPRAAVTPAWSNGGDRIAYTSADQTQDGRLGGGENIASEADIYTVPFNDGNGGNAAPLAGAADPGIAEYYPDWSVDDRLVAFNRAPSNVGKHYYREDGEVYVVPSTGGLPHRLAANDPVACSSEVSPGVINSWAKWSPEVSKVGGKLYYWVVFSSARYSEFDLERAPWSPKNAAASQLYVAAVVVDEKTGAIESFPGSYLTNQRPTTSNLTPAWDYFKIDDTYQ